MILQPGATQLGYLCAKPHHDPECGNSQENTHHHIIQASRILQPSISISSSILPLPLPPSILPPSILPPPPFPRSLPTSISSQIKTHCSWTSPPWRKRTNVASSFPSSRMTHQTSQEFMLRNGGHPGRMRIRSIRYNRWI